MLSCPLPFLFRFPPIVSPPHPHPPRQRRKTLPYLALLVGVVGGWWGCSWQGIAQAEPGATAPPEIHRFLAQMDTAANRRDLAAVMEGLSPEFVHGDGLTRPTYEQVLQHTWQQFPDLHYTTELLDWQAQGEGFSLETVTRIRGVQTLPNRQFQMEATLRSRQYLQGQQLQRQEILAERCQLTSGSTPPTVRFKLPETVKTGDRYDFDAIVVEPLNDDLLLGGVLEEPVRVAQYFENPPLDLEALNSGGIFRVGQAPILRDQAWFSVLFIREGGITTVSQRIRFVEPEAMTPPTP